MVLKKLGLGSLGSRVRSGIPALSFTSCLNLFPYPRRRTKYKRKPLLGMLKILKALMLLTFFSTRCGIIVRAQCILSKTVSLWNCPKSHSKILTNPYMPMMCFCTSINKFRFIMQTEAFRLHFCLFLFDHYACYARTPYSNWTRQAHNSKEKQMGIMRRGSGTTYAYQLNKIKRLFPVPGFPWRDYGLQELK